MSDAALFATRLVIDLQAAWADLVELTFAALEEGANLDQVAETVAKRGKKGSDKLRRNMKAIQHLQDRGLSKETIITLGEHAALSEMMLDRRKDEQEKRVHMDFIIPGSLRDACRMIVRPSMWIG